MRAHNKAMLCPSDTPKTAVTVQCRWTGAAALGVCLLLMGVTSYVDPGTVTEDNEAFHCSLYAYDDVTNTQKECETCDIKRPARSKHCKICNRCVP